MIPFDFENFMAECDRIANEFAGLDTIDLPDYSYRDCFDAGMSPYETTLEALFEAGFEF